MRYNPLSMESAKGRLSGKLVKAFNVSDLPDLEASPNIERCEYLASYNWLDQTSSPIILVPGTYKVLVKL